MPRSQYDQTKIQSAIVYSADKDLVADYGEDFFPRLHEAAKLDEQHPLMGHDLDIVGREVENALRSPFPLPSAMVGKAVWILGFINWIYATVLDVLIMNTMPFKLVLKYNVTKSAKRRE